jgi:hypothetical protein
MDLESLTDDEIADLAKNLMDDLHRRQAAMSDGALKTRLGRLLAMVHGAMGALHAEAQNASIIRPYSGGDQKPPV